jgi:hypothetical protein
MSTISGTTKNHGIVRSVALALSFTWLGFPAQALAGASVFAHHQVIGIAA